MVFYFKETKKDIIMTQEDEEDYKKIIFVDFARKILNLIKLVITVI